MIPPSCIDDMPPLYFFDIQKEIENSDNIYESIIKKDSYVTTDDPKSEYVIIQGNKINALDKY